MQSFTYRYFTFPVHQREESDLLLSFIYSFTHTCIHLCSHLFIYSFIYLSIHLFIYSFIYLSIHSYICLFICLYLWPRTNHMPCSLWLSLRHKKANCTHGHIVYLGWPNPTFSVSLGSGTLMLRHIWAAFDPQQQQSKQKHPMISPLTRFWYYRGPL